MHPLTTELIEHYGPTLPSVGDFLNSPYEEGGVVTVVDVAPWNEIKTKYPELAVKALRELPPELPEKRLGRAWVLRSTSSNGMDHLWITGLATIKLMASMGGETGWRKP